MSPIFLIGYMCSGKSTLGRVVAEAMGMEFIDLDYFIENRYRKTISEIFAENGEEYFRELERKTLHEVAEFEDTIIACGGGTPCHFDNMEFMNNAGITIYLNSSVDSLSKRLCVPISKRKRPLIAKMTDSEVTLFLAKTIATRSLYYELSQLTFDTSHIDNSAEVGNSTTELTKLINSKIK
ncbi:MAG: shikimate kinase [Bacteroidales bacterium]